MRHQSSRDLKERVALTFTPFTIFKNQLYVHIRVSHHPYKPFQYNALLYQLLNKAQLVEQCLVV